MLPIKEKFIVDENGNQVSVVLDIADYHRLLEEMEELADIIAYLKAKALGDEFIPFEQAIAEIEQNHPEKKLVEEAQIH